MTNTIANTARTLALTAFAAGAMTVAQGLTGTATAEASAPKACVQEVMHGGINWGGGTRWDPKNAAALCKGAVDYHARITCFTGYVAGGTHWSNAIQYCQKIGKTAPPPPPPPVIKGHDVGMVYFGGGTYEQKDGYWIETGAHGQERFRFKETHRDEWSVYLYDQSREVYLQLDLHRDMVYYQGSPLYPITKVDYARPVPPAPPKPPKMTTYNVKTGPIWNTYDAQGKCKSLAASYGAEWTGQWWTVAPGKMSVCQIRMMS